MKKIFILIVILSLGAGGYYYYQNSELEVIDLFINVGGGIYTTGDSLKRNSLQVGIIYPGDINIDINQTVLERFLDLEIPVINISNIERLSEWYKNFKN